MASLATFYNQAFHHFRLSHHRRSQPKPNSYRILQKPLFPSAIIRASSSSNPNNFLKTTCVTLLPPPSSTVADLSETEEEIEDSTYARLIEVTKILARENPERKQSWRISSAHTLANIGYFDSAARECEVTLSKDPLCIEAYGMLIFVYSTAECISKLSELEPRINEATEKCKKEDVPSFKHLIALIKIRQEKLVEAIRVYQELVEDDPMDFRAHLYQGLVYTLMKEEAEKKFEEFKRLVPEDHPDRKYFDEYFDKNRDVNELKSGELFFNRQLLMLSNIIES